MNIDHLHTPNPTGWGYMQPTKEVLDAYAWVESKVCPRRVIEFGFHAGHSTTYQLETFPGSSIVTYGVSRETTQAAHNMKKKYGGRFTFRRQDTQTIDPLEFFPGVFDYALVDAMHTYKNVAYEISLLLQWKVPYILFDNCETPAVQRAIDDKLTNGQLVKEFPYQGDWKGVQKPLMMKLYHVPANSF